MIRDVAIRIGVGTVAVVTVIGLLYLIALIIENYIEFVLGGLLVLMIYVLGYLLLDCTYKYFKR